MSKILLLETATEVCSVGLWDTNALIIEENAEQTYQHTSALTILIEQVMAKAGWTNSQLDAVAISSGPGSYTALRVGAATAKGMCFAGDLPLIGVDTLHSLAWAIQQQLPTGQSESIRILPMIDARRMEVYGALYNNKLELLQAPSAIVVDADKLTRIQGPADKLYIGGNGAEKCRELLTPSQYIIPVQCAAAHLGPLAQHKFEQGVFEDIAYFSPNYLKPPNITTPKPVWN